MFIAIKIIAPTDKNGNPRRGWIIHRLWVEDKENDLPPNSQVWDFVDEGFEGDRALKNAYPDAYTICEINVPIKEYNFIKKEYSKCVTGKMVI